MVKPAIAISYKNFLQNGRWLTSIALKALLDRHTKSAWGLRPAAARCKTAADSDIAKEGIARGESEAGGA